MNQVTDGDANSQTWSSRVILSRLSVMMFLQYFIQGSYLPIASVYVQDALEFTGKEMGYFGAALAGVGDLDGSGQPETDPNEQDQWSEYDQPTLPDGFGFAVRLQETEGRHRSTTLRCWRTPIMARQRDFEGRTLAELPIEGDGVRVDLTAHEIADIELRFD